MISFGSLDISNHWMFVTLSQVSARVSKKRKLSIFLLYIYSFFPLKSPGIKRYEFQLFTFSTLYPSYLLGQMASWPNHLMKVVSTWCYDMNLYVLNDSRVALELGSIRWRGPRDYLGQKTTCLICSWYFTCYMKISYDVHIMQYTIPGM